MKQILLDLKHSVALLELFGGTVGHAFQDYYSIRELLPRGLDLHDTWIVSLSTLVTMFYVPVFPINLLFERMQKED